MSIFKNKNNGERLDTSKTKVNIKRKQNSNGLP